MSERVTERIREEIRERGPITFARFMELALYGPGGFYDDPPIGAERHFVTSPHVHPVFADLVRFALLDAREALGRPEPFRVVELGAGDGTLARELRFGFEQGGVDAELIAVEISAGARARLSDLGLRVLERVEDLGSLEPGVVLANELLDNLPFRRVRGTADALAEVLVDLDGDRLVELEVPCPDDAALLAPSLGPGEEATVPVGAFALVEALARLLRRGYVLLIDYGAVDGPAGEVHGYRDHTVLEDVLADPGGTDVTAGVDLGAVARRAQEAGLVALGVTTQWRALLALGYERWSEAELGRQVDLLETRRGVEAVRAWEGRSRASLLVDPAVLGRLRWLLLSTPELPRPAWLEAALAAEG